MRSLIRVAAAGVCRSDWNVLTGDTKHPMPVVNGHEGAGYVEAVGPGVTHVQPGDRVALNWAPNCGECFYCLNDRPSLCETYVDAIWAGTMMDGTSRMFKEGQPLYQFCSLGCFAEYTVVPAISCVKIPDGTPLSIAALIGCAVTTGVGAAVNTAQVKAGSKRRRLRRGRRRAKCGHGREAIRRQDHHRRGHCRGQARHLAGVWRHGFRTGRSRCSGGCRVH